MTKLASPFPAVRDSTAGPHWDVRNGSCCYRLGAGSRARGAKQKGKSKTRSGVRRNKQRGICKARGEGDWHQDPTETLTLREFSMLMSQPSKRKN